MNDSTTPAATTLPDITPKPQQVEALPGACILAEKTIIQCRKPETPRQKNTLSLLAGSIKAHSGLELDVEHNADLDLEIRIRNQPSEETQAGGSIPLELDKAEGYALSIGPEGIVIRGVDEAGLFYGVQTLRQIVQAAGKTIPCARITDWPDIPFRALGPFCGGHKVDSKHRNRELYVQLAGYCAANKLNRIAFEIGMLPNDDDLKAFGDFCRLNFIEPVPLQHYLNFRRKAVVEYVEASDEEFKRIMEPFEQAVRLLNPQIFCIAGDELINTFTYQDRSTIYTPEQLGKRPAHQWLLLCLKRFHKYITDRGVRMAMWADGLIDERTFEGAPASVYGYGGEADEHCKMVDDLPRDIVMWDWQYEPQSAFPTMDYLQKKGFDTIGCPFWKANWNVALFAEYAHRNRTDKFMGMLCTDWSGCRYMAAPLAGDCFWSVGKYAREYPDYPPLVEKTRFTWPQADGPAEGVVPLPFDEHFEAFKTEIATNPLLDVAPGTHSIVIKGEPYTNGRLLAARSIGLNQVRLADYGGLATYAGREAAVTYMVQAKPNCHFTRCILSLEVEERFKSSLAIADGAEGGEYRDIAPIEHEKETDLTQHVAGANSFRFRIKGINTHKAPAVILRGIRVDCTVEQDK